MKKIIFTLYLFYAFVSATAQSPNGTMYTNGNKTYDSYGEQFLARGVNYPVLDDWDFPGNNGVSSQIALSGANVVRIAWYNDYSNVNRPPYALSDLNNELTRFKNLGIFCVIDLHDLTGKNDAALFQTRLIDWWTSAPVVAMLQNHKDHIIINMANEYGPTKYDINGDPNPNYNAELQGWASTIESGIISIRNAGLKMPIIIDAPGFGSDYVALQTYRDQIFASDPLQNIIFSLHAYWESIYGFDENTLRTIIKNISLSKYPYMLGETAFYDFACRNNIYMDKIIQYCQENYIGWMAWAWYKDGCAPRRVTTDGNFANLTAHSGQAVVNDPNYGLQATSKKTAFAQSNFTTQPINDNQKFMAMPYYGDKKIKVLRITDGRLINDFDISAGVNALGGGGTNAVKIVDDKVIVSVDVNINTGGLLIYNLSDVASTPSAAAIATITGTGMQELAIHPVSGDLYVATYNNGASSGRIARYTAASNFSAASVTYLPAPNFWVNYMAGLAFDANNNLYTFSITDPSLIIYTSASNYASYYVVRNAGSTYPAKIKGGGTQNVHLFSWPESAAIDQAGNLWVGNNNEDGLGTNPSGDGTIVKISAAFLSNLFAQPVSGSNGNLATTYTVPINQTEILLIKGSKFGQVDILNDNTTLLAVDQGYNQGSNWEVNGMIWKYDISTSAAATPQIIPSNMRSTYPGLGGFDFFAEGDIILPADGVDETFSGKLVSENSVELSWVSEGSIVPKLFEIMYSFQNGSFSSIGKVEGKSTAASYTFLHNNLKSGIHQYYIKTIKDNGFPKITQSILLITKLEPHILLYPNPAATAIYIADAQQSIAGAEFEIVDVAGRRLLKGKLANASQNRIDISKLPNTLYLLKVAGRSFKFVKE